MRYHLVWDMVDITYVNLEFSACLEKRLININIEDI